LGLSPRLSLSSLTVSRHDDLLFASSACEFLLPGEQCGCCVGRVLFFGPKMFGLALAALSLPTGGMAKEIVTNNGVWCAKIGLGDHFDEHAWTNSPTVSYRGKYRDFALFVQNSDTLSECNSFTNHMIGNDGIWVIEEPSAEALAKTTASLKGANLPIYFTQGYSLVVGGGSEVPNVTGLDGCGADEDTSFIPVPDISVTPAQPTKELLREWKQKQETLNPVVEMGVAAVSESSLISSISYLQDYFTRNSYSETIHGVTDYLVKRLETLGYEIELYTFRDDMAPNVIATWPSSSPVSEWIITGAHYDSRNTNSSSPDTRAPGADDNASGSAAMLELATIVSQTIAPQNKLQKGFQICFFTGEEQGLLGSRALAADWMGQGKKIAAMVNADMLGYQAGEKITLGFKDRSITPELVTLAKELTALYVPTLPTADSTSCCSDYLAFYEVGYPAVGFFESGMTASDYPAYHTDKDLIANVNTAQLRLETQAVVATVLTLVL
jgi:hypothetical protein